MKRIHFSVMAVVLVLALALPARAEVVASVDIGTANDDAWGSGTCAIFSGWEAPATYQGRTARLHSRDAIDAMFQATLPPNGGTVYVTYFDDAALATGLFARIFENDWDGDTWEDVLLGAIPFDGTNTWRTVGIPLPAEDYDTFAAAEACLTDPGDAPWIADVSEADGYQIVFGRAGAGLVNNVINGWAQFPPDVYYDKIEVDTTKVWTLDVGNVVDEYNPNNAFLMYINWFDVDAGDWGNVQTTAGATARMALCDSLGAPPFYVTLDPDTNYLSITVYDNDAANAPGFSLWIDNLDGDSWQDYFVMNVELDGTGGWETTEATIPAQDIIDTIDDVTPTGAATTDCRGGFMKPGHQILVRMFAYTPDMEPLGFHSGDILVDKVTVASEQQVVPVNATQYWAVY